MAFYVYKRKKQVTCRITELKENNIYNKGKFQLCLEEGEQRVSIINSCGKVQGTAVINISLVSKKEMRSKTGVNLATDTHYKT